MKRYQCPCCGYFTFEGNDEMDIMFDFCDVCFWQYDSVVHDDPDGLIGANHITLSEARQNYRKFGASKEKLVGTNRVRPPITDELPENNR